MSPGSSDILTLERASIYIKFMFYFVDTFLPLFKRPGHCFQRQSKKLFILAERRKF